MLGEKSVDIKSFKSVDFGFLVCFPLFSIAFDLKNHSLELPRQMDLAALKLPHLKHFTEMDFDIVS